MLPYFASSNQRQIDEGEEEKIGGQLTVQEQAEMNIAHTILAYWHSKDTFLSLTPKLLLLSRMSRLLLWMRLRMTMNDY